MKVTTEVNRSDILTGKIEADLWPANWHIDTAIPDFGFNIFNKLGRLYTPVLDQQMNERPTWPDGKKFAVCLTHDVDSVSKWALRQRWDGIVYAIKHLNTTGSAKRLFANAYHYANSLAHKLSTEPNHDFEKWLRVESKFDAHSTFFFFPEKVRNKHLTDCCYCYDKRIKFGGHNCTVKEMMREIDTRGWEIGLHASWHSFDNIDEMKFQKGQIEDVIGHEITSIRQHYLHSDIRYTPAVQNCAGFKYDSSLGFNNNIGFRFGTSYPWHLYDLDEKKQLNILEIPLIIMDNALLDKKKGLILDVETAIEYCKIIIEEVKKINGVVTLLWHPGNNDEWLWVYEQALNYANQNCAWFGSTNEVGDWWIKNSKGLNVNYDKNLHRD